MSKLSSDLTCVTDIGLDLAKHVFQVHCIDAEGRVLAARALRRAQLLPFFASLPPCRVGLEACGSAHHWGRALLALGHEVRMIPPAYVKPYVKRQKNDAADAAAICEAMSRPSMRFVAVRTIENQAALMAHKVREMLVAQRTQILNSLRGHMAEAGVITAQGASHGRALATLIETGHAEVPPVVATALMPLVKQLHILDEAVHTADTEMAEAAKACPDAKLLMSIPGIGPTTATALIATIGAGGIAQFSGPREFAAFLGLVPRQNSSGGKERLGRITKMGNQYIRKLLVVGAHAVLHHATKHSDPLRAWAKTLLATKPFKLVAVATANKMARLVYAILASQKRYTAAA